MSRWHFSFFFLSFLLFKSGERKQPCERASDAPTFYDMMQSVFPCVSVCLCRFSLSSELLYTFLYVNAEKIVGFTRAELTMKLVFTANSQSLIFGIHSYHNIFGNFILLRNNRLIF